MNRVLPYAVKCGTNVNVIIIIVRNVSERSKLTIFIFCSLGYQAECIASAVGLGL